MKGLFGLLTVVVVLGVATGCSSHSPSTSTSTSTSAALTPTPASTLTGPCTKGGSCGYDNVTAAEAVTIIANQTTGPGSLKSCSPTNGETAALKGAASSEWDCVNATTGETATYTINADGSVDY